MPLTIRPLTTTDGTAAADIFFAAVHIGTANLYSSEQRTAWAGRAPNPARWQHRFETVAGFGADKNGALVGFMTLDRDGYIDLAFVHPEHAGHGLGQRLYAEIETSAVAQNIPKLTTQASLAAKPFFTRMGWQVDAEQKIAKDGVSLTNFKMFKNLA